MDQPPTVVFTACTDMWPRATRTETGVALCIICMGRTLTFDFFDLCIAWTLAIMPVHSVLLSIIFCPLYLMMLF